MAARPSAPAASAVYESERATRLALLPTSSGRARDQRSFEMGARQLLGADRRVARGAVDQAHRSQGAMAQIGIGGDDGRGHNPARVSPAAPARDPPRHECAREGDHDRSRRRRGRRSCRAARGGEPKSANTADCERRLAGRTIDPVAPNPAEPLEGAKGFRVAARACRTVYRARLTGAMGKLKSGGQPFIEALRGGALVADGAMGTQLYERGILFSVNYEELNLSRPEVVRKVHEDYVARRRGGHRDQHVRRQRMRLARHGLDDKVRDINLRRRSRSRARPRGPSAYVAGSIGPDRAALRRRREDDVDAGARRASREQAEALVEAGVDLLVARDLAPARRDVARDRGACARRGPRRPAHRVRCRSTKSARWPTARRSLGHGRDR